MYCIIDYAQDSMLNVVHPGFKVWRDQLELYSRFEDCT